MPAEKKKNPLDEKIAEPERTNVEMKESPKEIDQPVSRLERIKIDLTPEQKTVILKDIGEEVSVIEKDMIERGLFEEWEICDSQYLGIVEDKDFPQYGMFNVNVPITRTKTKAVRSRLRQAFTETDPIWAVEPRSEDDLETSERQEDYLDYQADMELNLKHSTGKTFHSTSLKGNGWIKCIHKRETIRVGDFEEYKGINDLNKFIENYPDAEETHPEIYRKIKADKTVTIEVTYDFPIKDFPVLKFVNNRDMRVSCNTEGIEGMLKTRLISEDQDYDWAELVKLSKEKFFEKEEVEKLKTDIVDGKETLRADFAREKYLVREAIYFYDLDGDGENLQRICLWIAWDKGKGKGDSYQHGDAKAILRASQFPYWHNRPYWIPFFFTNERDGFYQDGLGYMLRDINIEANALHNYTLDAAWQATQMSVMVKAGTPMARTIMNRRWFLGMPIQFENSKEEISSLTLNHGDLSMNLAFTQLNQRYADDVSGVSSYMTGKESPTDPNAPAAKTAALLRESNINLKENILNMLPSMNELGFQIMELNYQFFSEAKKYRTKTRSILGGQPSQEQFVKMDRKDMRIRADYVSQAYSFAFDKINQKQENLALWAMFKDDPDIMKNPDKRYNFKRIIFQNFGGNWDMKYKEVLGTPEENRQAHIEMLKEAMRQMEKENQIKEFASKRSQELLRSGMKESDVKKQVGAEIQKMTQQEQPQGAFQGGQA